MAKQTLVFESAKDLSLSDGMIVITDKDTGEITLRSLEDVQMIMVDTSALLFQKIDSNKSSLSSS